VLINNRTEAQLSNILEEAAQHAGHEPKDLEGKVGAFYHAFMDEDRIEALGSTPVESTLTAIRAATTPEQLGRLIGRNNFDFEGTFFEIWIDADPRDPTRYAVFLSQGGLGLPDRDYYLQPAFTAQLAKYQQYIEQLLRLIGWPNAAGNAAAIVALETRIAEVSWTKAEQRDASKTYNPLTVSELEAFAPGFPWKQFLTEARLRNKAPFRRSRLFSPIHPLTLCKRGLLSLSSITRRSIFPSHSPTRHLSFGTRRCLASQSRRGAGSVPSAPSVAVIAPNNVSVQ
jgi:predicted metalloendopeptidase